MRVINRAEFLALRGDVLFSKYEHCFFGEIAISRGETYAGSGDFHVDEISGSVATGHNGPEAIMDAADSGESMRMDFAMTSRDGMFDEAQRFAVYEAADLEELIRRLQIVHEDTRRREGL